MPQILTVSDVNRYIKSLMAYDGVLSSVWVRGEISNYKRHYSGHLYFTLKDAGSLLKCVMFKTAADKLLFEPENGMKVMIRGSVSVFERDGVYQLYAEAMKADGVGDLHVAFEQLKAKLQAEGLFADSRKQPIPTMPHTIGVLTSETGSVIRDILNVLTRRFYPIHVKLYPCAVQGEGAARQLAGGVAYFNREKNCDVIIIARGGGSLEDLWPFNEEVLARAIADSEIPVISGVGHETDFTICDFVSDLRAPTPSAAAELAVPELTALQKKLASYKERVLHIPDANLRVKKQQLEKVRQRDFFRNPSGMVKDSRLTLASIQEDLEELMKQALKEARHQNGLLAARLDALSPLKILSRGYGVVQDGQGATVTTVAGVQVGDSVAVRLQDGKLLCRVEEREIGCRKNKN